MGAQVAHTVSRLEGLVPRECFGGTTHVFQPKAGKSMKHPTPSDFIVNVKESHVSVMFKPTDSYYNFGRLTDPGDIARHGPLSQSPNVRHAKTGDTAASRACRSPIAASREAVIVEIFESRSIGRTQRRQSPSALAAVAYVQGTERPGHRKFTEGHELHRKLASAKGDDRTAIVSGGSEEVAGELGIRAVPDYEECIGAKKHLVLGLLTNTGPGSNSFATGL
jgi:hypothetical protein